MRTRAGGLATPLAVALVAVGRDLTHAESDGLASLAALRVDPDNALRGETSFTNVLGPEGTCGELLRSYNHELRQPESVSRNVAGRPRRPAPQPWSPIPNRHGRSMAEQTWEQRANGPGEGGSIIYSSAPMPTIYPEGHGVESIGE